MWKFLMALRTMAVDIAFIRAIQEKIMSSEDDLKSAVASLTTAVTSENNQIDTLVSQLAAGAASAGMPDADVQSLTSQITALTSGINSKLAQFTPPTPSPAPAPDPTAGS